jgi:uncharacterized protein YcbK (DUF882 family)
VAFSTDGLYVVTGGADGTVRVWERATGRQLRLLRSNGAPVRTIAVSRNGLVAVAAEEPEVSLYPLGGGRGRKLRGHTDWVQAVAFSSQGDRLASGGHDRVVRIWEPTSGRVIRILRGHTLWVNALAFSPDGKHLATAGLENRCLVWDMETGAIDHGLRGHQRHIAALAFDPAGHLLASASLDRTVNIWDVAQSSIRYTLTGHQWMVSSVAFARDGRFILSASTDGNLRIWPLPLPQPVVAERLAPAGPGEATLRNNTTGERLRLKLLDDRGEATTSARERLAEFLRSGPDDRRGSVDPELIQLLDSVAGHFGRNREIIVVSGYRSREYNKLRTLQSRGVAKESQHLEGKAMDIRLEGITIMALRDFLKKLRRGGVGFYPDSNFVHMDTGKVRYWSGE